MNEKPKETRARVYLRRAVLAALDAAIVAFSFYFALLLRADGAVEAAWWPHNLAILYQNLPWIVAVYVASFLLGGLYSVLWKYAGERDLLRLAVMVAVPTGIVYAVNRLCIHGVLFNSANCMAAGLILLGCEVLYYSARPGACRCDFGSVVLCLLMMGGCFGVSTLMLLAQMLGRGCTIHLSTQESRCSSPAREGLHRLFRLKRGAYCTPVSSASLW